MPQGRHRPAVDRRADDGQPLCRAGDSRRAARRGHPRAGQEPRQPRPRAVDRRPGAHQPGRIEKACRHPPRLLQLREEDLPQPAAVAHPHRAAPPHPATAHHLRPEPHRRQARAHRPAVPAGHGPGLRRPHHREPLQPRPGLERRLAAGDARRAGLYPQPPRHPQRDADHREPLRAAQADRRVRQRNHPDPGQAHAHRPRNRHL